MRRVLLVVENIVLLLCGVTVGWIAVTYPPGVVLPVVGIALALAAGGRLLFDGTMWTAGLGMVVAAVGGAWLYIADAVTSLGN